MRPLIIMTGTTRYLGSHFLRVAKDTKSIVPLVCAKDEETAGRMISEAVALARIAHDERTEMSADSPFRPLVSDYQKQDLGLSDSAIAAVLDKKNVYGSLEFWHFEYDPNPGLTDLCLKLADKLGAFRFVCLSSIQPCAVRTGNTSSSGNTGGGNGDWTRMESRIGDFCRGHGMDFRILRVPMLVGPSLTKKWEGCDSRFLDVVKTLIDHRSELLELGKPISLRMNPDARLDLMPVDHGIGDIRLLFEGGFPGGPIYHLTSNVRVTAGFAFDYLNKTLGLNGLSLVPDARQDALEGRLQARIEPFATLLNPNDTSVRALDGRAGVTRYDFFSYVHEAVRVFDGEGNLDLFDRTVMPVNGVRLNVYTCGNRQKPPLLLINAVGMPVDLWSKTAKYLKDRYCLYTWESRGVPSRFQNEPEGPWSIDDHLRDGLAAMDRFGLESAHVAGWCSGAQVATKLAANHPQRVKTLVLLNGIFSLKDRSCTSEFMGVLGATMTKVARSRKYADMYFRLNYGAKQKELPDIEPGSLELEYDPALFHLTSFPFKDPESLFQYANLVKCMVSEHTDDWIDRIGCPTLVVSGGKDITAGPKSSRKVAQQLPDGSAFREIETGDHYSICYDDQVSVMIDDFIQSCRESRGVQ